MFLLDTDALSISGPQSGYSGPEVDIWRSWVHWNSQRLFLSSVTIMEIRFGIEKAKAQGATAKAARLGLWFVAFQANYGSRILPVTAAIADKAGDILCKAIHGGISPGTEDAIIAATSMVHGFQLLSRNGRHMKPLGADWFDPLGPLPLAGPP